MHSVNVCFEDVFSRDGVYSLKNAPLGAFFMSMCENIGSYCRIKNAPGAFFKDFTVYTVLKIEYAFLKYSERR